MSDKIEINQLRVSTHIGVPDEERAEAQEVDISVTMIPEHSWRQLNDDISRTVDYYQVAMGIEKVSRERPRQLIETLAEDLSSYILQYYSVSAVRVRIDKYILPNAKSVAVEIEREI